MEGLELAYASVRGNMHRLRDLPNQDAIDIQEFEELTLISLADGHGSPVCFRSEVGAKYAVETANALLRTHWSKVDPDRPEDREKLAKKIARGWMSKCLKHLRANAFTDQEVSTLNAERRKRLGQNALLAYGSTLMSLIVTADKVTVLNIGDAELLIKRNDGSPVEQLKPSAQLGNETESLALNQAEQYFTLHVYERDNLQALLAATDGYPNSFRNDKGFLKVLDDLMSIHTEHGMEAIQSNLQVWLEDTSQKGSGDDITACLMVV